MGKCKSSKSRSRSRSPRIIAAQTLSETVTLDVVCDVNFQLNLFVDACTIKFYGARPGLEGKIILDCERETPSSNILVYVPVNTKYVYDRNEDPFLSNTSTISAVYQARNDTISVAPGGTVAITYYFDTRNVPYFDIKHYVTPTHVDDPALDT